MACLPWLCSRGCELLADSSAVHMVRLWEFAANSMASSLDPRVYLWMIGASARLWVGVEVLASGGSQQRAVEAGGCAGAELRGLSGTGVAAVV